MFLLHRFIRDSYEHAENDESVIDENLEKLKRLLMKFNAKPIEVVPETPRAIVKIQDSVEETAKKNYLATLKMIGSKMTEEQKVQLQRQFGIHIDPTPRPRVLNYGNMFD